jgi:Lrp/AsnC family leucine-responsive transcriptional regulator
MSKRLSPPAAVSLDATDRAIVAALADDARIATSELARQIGLSAPATADRVRRLEAQGVIAGFTVELDPRALGYTLQAIVRVKPLPGQLHLVEDVLRRIRIRRMRQGHRRGLLHLPAVPAHDRAPRRHPVESDGARRNSTAIVKSTPVPRRLPPLVDDDAGRR